ncbi:unnamed protein product [Rotaria socialis]|uniref:Innexin n=1 Tax=Rotaria socialis TaxID=392032 RepID=A0A821GSS3_9BILA|nr:unnamed protein product [Rotaria socialis]CAF4323341.1 unnamed protein product [Rotaria socialis]CAF4363925.1 unnamed protein product [Rotaria socialis]CAF4528908.1 unnamed protein product [Rotaria socialis]CAF4673900.1 unnamed protein product [Rotaria socialis]
MKDPRLRNQAVKHALIATWYSLALIRTSVLQKFDLYTVLRYYCGFGRNDDDFVDRLSRYYSVLIFSVFIVIVSSVQFVGKPISCFAPASFSDAHIIYADFICWISDTYFISIDAEIPEPDDLQARQGSNAIRFYQYVPFILMLQTCGFFLPGFFWRSGSSRLGIPLQKHLDQLNMSRRSIAEPPMYRRQLIRNVASRLDQYFRMRHRAIIPKLTFLYLLTKLIYITNIFIQLISLHYLMNFELKFNSLFHHFIIYNNTIRHVSLQFPTNVLCDFIVRFLGKNKHPHTVQCVLPINVFNEKIFIFAYLWLIFLLICALYNLLIQWLLFILFHRTVVDTRVRRFRSISSKYRTDDNYEENKPMYKFDRQPITKNFSQRYLCCDGIVIMRLFDMNIDLVTMNDLMDDLWELYKINPI